CSGGRACDMSPVRVRELVRKEFIQLFRDRKNRPLLIIAPLIQLLVFGYVVSTDVRDVRVAWMDHSRTLESRRLSDSLDANRTFRITHRVDDPKELERILLAQEADLGIKIPPDFSERIRSQMTASVQILADGSMSNMASMRIAYTRTVLDSFNSRLLEELYAERMEYGRIDARVRTWYNPNLDSRNFYVPGIVAFLIMLTSLLFTSMAIIREKEGGTIEQLIVTPMKPFELILGKTIPYILISVTQMVAVAVFALLWFSIPLKGSVPLLFGATLVFLLSTLGVGLFISTVSATQQQAMMTTFFFILPFFMLSGFVFPISNMPAPVQFLTYLNPLRHFLTIIRGVFLKGVGFEILWPELVALAAIGSVVFLGAVKRFGKRMD
ncbi:MAG: ABC transporter permease, partial [Deltaproteobacteria bacterium]|nr:ABC transporter permease [Deltaproteobacteria bacterium]